MLGIIFIIHVFFTLLCSVSIGMRLSFLRQSLKTNVTRRLMTKSPGETPAVARFWRPMKSTGVKAVLLHSLLLTKSCFASSSPLRQPHRWLSSAAGGSSPNSISAEAFNTVIKRPLDDRDYKALTLDNGLRVLLISDSKSSRSAAALDVHAGYFSDPKNLPGLAHFCEHMSFLGTKKYPKEEEFSSFLAANGGSSNAYTDSEDTVYYFDVNADQLEGSLDRFGQFFEAPLFSESATARELNAIDSEHAKNINSDGFRLHQLDRDSANPAHPLNRFATGNKDTLLTQSEKQGINLRQSLLDFHAKFYTAGLMTLTVLGKQPVSDLEKWVKSAFSRIPSGVQKDPALEWWGKVPPYLPQTSATVMEVVPVADSRSLTMSWPIAVPSPAAREALKRHKPDLVLSHLIGHEGPGSLRSALVKRGYVLSVQAYTGTDVSDCAVFDVNIDLTELGHQHRYEVAAMVLAYVDLLRAQYTGSSGLPAYLLDELRTMSQVSFNYAEKSDPSSYVSALASNMQTYKHPSEYLTGVPLFSQPDQEQVKAYLLNLTPENTRMMSISPDFQNKTDQVGRYYGTEFRNISLAEGSEEEKKTWKRLKTVRASDYPELALPLANELIPQRFDLVSDASEVAVGLNGPVFSTVEEKNVILMAPPTLVRNDALWQVWHKTDVSFKQPKVYTVIDLAAPRKLVSASFAAKSRLFASCFLESESEFLYTAKLAGLGLDIDLSNRGLQLVLSGFSDKMPLFAQKSCAALLHFRPDEATFERYKEQFLRDLGNFNTQQPYYHASYYASLALESGRFTVAELIAATQALSVRDLEAFLPTHYSSSYGKALVMGNIDAPGAEHLVRVVQSTLPFTALPSSERNKISVTLIPTAPVADPTSTEPRHLAGYRVAHPEPNPKDTNSAACFHLQLPSRDPHEYMRVELLAEVLEQPFYHSLRTQQQLGYIVSASLHRREGIRYLTFLAQSSIADGAELTRRIETFLDAEVTRVLDELTEADLAVFKQGITVRKLEPDQRLTSQAGRFWTEIMSQSVPLVSLTTAVDGKPLPQNSASVPAPLFDRRAKEVETLQKITLEEFKAFTRSFLSAESGQRRLLVSQITSTVQGEESAPAAVAVPEGESRKYVEIAGTEENFQRGAEML